jgi:dUTP pyrophosphatase
MDQEILTPRKLNPLEQLGSGLMILSQGLDEVSYKIELLSKYISLLPEFLVDNIEISKIEDDAVLPSRNNNNDVGIDLYCYGSYSLEPHKTEIIRTGIKIKFPKGFFGLIKPKGKSNHLIGAGVVDEGYQGEILIKIVNTNKDKKQIITHGAPVGQLVLVPTIYPEIVEVKMDKLFKENTSRGNTGGIIDQLVEEDKHE